MVVLEKFFLTLRRMKSVKKRATSMKGQCRNTVMKHEKMKVHARTQELGRREKNEKVRL